MDNSQGYSQIISNRKIVSVLKRTWLKGLIVIVLAAVISVAAGVVQYKQGKIGSYTTKASYYHGYIYVYANWQDENIVYDSQEQSAYEQYAIQRYIEQKHTNIIDETRMLLYEDEIKNELNKRLESAGYDNLMAEDSFNITTGSGRYFIITVDSKSTEERTRYLVEQAADIVLKEARERFDLAECTMQPSETYPEKKDNNTYKRIDITTVQKSMPSAVLSAKTTKYIMILGIGIAVIIILTGILRDKRLYDKKEIEPYIGRKCLYDGNNAQEVAVPVIEARCNAADTKDVSIITFSHMKQKNGIVITDILNGLADDGISSELYENIIENTEEFKNIYNTDGIILVVQKERDKGADIYNFVQMAQAAEADILGYIWI